METRMYARYLYFLGGGVGGGGGGGGEGTLLPLSVCLEVDTDAIC